MRLFWSKVSEFQSYFLPIWMSFCSSAYHVTNVVFAVLWFCGSSEVRSERCEETCQVEQDEQCSNGLCLLHRPHQHLHHSTWIWGACCQVGHTAHTYSTLCYCWKILWPLFCLLFLPRSFESPALSIPAPHINPLPIDLNMTGGI